VIALTGTVASNAVTIPVSANGGACSDPASGLSGTQLQSLANKTNVNSLGVAIGATKRSDGSGSVSAVVLAGVLGGANYGKGYEYASQGSCTIVPPAQNAVENIVQAPPLDAGSIQVSGPGGQTSLSGPGIYQGQLSANSPAIAPGTYTFTASGGKDIGAFKVGLNVQTPLTLTNASALTSITRSQGATVTWSGGYANGDVQVEAGIGGPYGTVRFYCHAPTGAGQLAIPASVLMAMAAGSGSLTVTNYSPAQTVTASGADIALAVVSTEFALNVTLK
jgi:hypothetical protein